VESARRLEVYDMIFDTFGRERVAAVAMLDTYRVRHAIRDVGAAMSLPPGEIDAIAKSFPRIRARDAREAMRELPELRRANLGGAQLSTLFNLVEALDGLPRHIALHPCGVILSDATLRDRTPVESSAQGYPMSQFDKDDVEDVGLLKLDVLGVRMQSAMAHAVNEIGRVQGRAVDLEALEPFDDEAVYDMIGRAETIGCFQIESPGQRELVGKFGPDCFEDLIVDISLFRPGPVKSDMVIPFLRARNGWAEPRYPHPDLEGILRETRGVMVYHEQIIKTVAAMTGCSLAHGDEARRALSSLEGQQDVKRWFFPVALARGYPESLVEEVWGILESFASFGFCKAHAAAFALPTYQSAWLKHHHPAAFFAGLLTHDPGMYPKRLILSEARRVGVPILPLDVNASGREYTLEEAPAGWGVRLALADVRGITGAEVDRILAARPFASLTDFVQRAAPADDVAERLALVGAFDSLYGIGPAAAVGVRGTVTRRDLLLALSDLGRVAARSRGGATQHVLDLAGVETGDVVPSGLPELTAAERLEAELDVLGLDASAHVLDEHMPFLEQIGVTWSRELLGRRSGSRLLVAGVKVATQTPAVRSGRRVVFLSLDDSTGPVDLTLFPDSQGRFARTVFNGWLLVGVGELRRTGPRGVSLRAVGVWDMHRLRELWERTLAATGDAGAATASVHALIESELSPDGPGRKLWHSSSGSSGR
jgi:error-prone DNA polymerase